MTGVTFGVAIIDQCLVCYVSSAVEVFSEDQRLVTRLVLVLMVFHTETDLATLSHVTLSFACGALASEQKIEPGSGVTDGVLVYFTPYFFDIYKRSFVRITIWQA